MIAPPEALVTLFKPWADYYSDSKLAETIVTFLHVGPLVIGGGIAVAADRNTFRAAGWNDETRRFHLAEVARLHTVVIASLVVVVLSGLMLLAADLETFFGSWIYWAKMLLFVLLLVNGLVMRGVESKLAVDSAGTSPRWGTLRKTAAASIVLWLAVTFAGVALMNYA